MGPGSHQVFRDTDQHLSHVLLLAAGEVGPQLMGSNPVVAWGRGRRTGEVGWHSCCLLDEHGGCRGLHAVIVSQRQAREARRQYRWGQRLSGWPAGG